MNLHHRRFVLRQWIEHKNPENLRLHVLANSVGWLALTTLLSQVPLPVGVPVLGANLGAWFVVFTLLYWGVVDRLVVGILGVLSVGWALAPFAPWGPGHTWVEGVLLPLVAFTVQGVGIFFAHIYYHEHAPFLANEEKVGAVVETTHAVIFGAAHFWLEWLLTLGWRPALKAELDDAERAAISRRDHVPWQNWSGTSRCVARRVYVPGTREALVEAVREARRDGLNVRVVGSGFTWSGVIATDACLIFCERLHGVEVDRSDPHQPAVWVEAGATNRQLNRVLEREGLTLPYNVVLETVRVAGIVSLGTHGSGRDTGTMGDLLLAMEVVSASGELRLLSPETVGAEVMDAARLGLGLFGVITRIKLRVEPVYCVLQRDRLMEPARVLAELPALIREHDSVELYWFAFTDRYWLRTLTRLPDGARPARPGPLYLLLNFIQSGMYRATTEAVLKLHPAGTPAALRALVKLLTFSDRVLTQAEAQHYRKWVELVKCRCVEIGFKVDPDFTHVRQAWAMTHALVEAERARGAHPLNLTVNARFIGGSGALLSPAFGPGLTCYIEALSLRGTPGWEAFSGELCRQWLTIPGALPHWAKEIEQIPDLPEVLAQRLGARLDHFRAALAAVGADATPGGAFSNPLLGRLLGGGGSTGVAGAGPVGAG